jgi:hypothetical protein
MPWEYVFRLGLVACFALLVYRSARGHAREAFWVFWLPIAFGAAVVVLQWIWNGQLDVFPLGLALVFSLSQPVADVSPPASAVLSHRAAPAVIGFLTALTTLAVWGTLDAVPVVHDEAAYLLQSRIFMTGRWTAPGRPFPEFFEQVHVFVTPVLASKYPPGHSMALLPGVVLGLPGLMPVVLSGVSGGLLFLLARRFFGGWVALLAWVIWLSAPAPLEARTSYLSESTSTALWLSGWWTLVRWRENGRPGELRLLALISGALCLTRPLTMLAFAIPTSLIVLRDVARRKAWKDLALAALLGGLVLAVVPLWSMRTLGTWRTTPYQYYSAVYYPYESFGFGLREAPALRPYPWVLEPLDRLFRGIHKRHQVRELPSILGDRLAAIARDIWGPGRRFLVVFAVLGALAAGPPIPFALAACATLVAAYLSYAHAPQWTPYYSAVYPVLAVVTALGLRRFALAVVARLDAARRAPSRPGLAPALAILPLLPTFLQLDAVRTDVREKSVDKREFRAVLSRIPEEKAIVFVRYALGHNSHSELIANEPDLDAARIWIVYDRGEENVRILRAAPERTPYVYVEARRALEPLSRVRESEKK